MILFHLFFKKQSHINEASLQYFKLYYNLKYVQFTLVYVIESEEEIEFI